MGWNPELYLVKIQFLTKKLSMHLKIVLSIILETTLIDDIDLIKSAVPLFKKKSVKLAYIFPYIR